METKERKSWKQPIRTEMKEFGEDESARTLYILLLVSAANSEQKVMVDNQIITLQRGQVIYGRYSYAEKMGIKPNESHRVSRMLSRLVKTHNKIDIKPSNKCTVVTIKNYEEETRMDNKTDIKQTTDRQQTDTHKSDKSVKNREYLLSLPLEDINQLVKKFSISPEQVTRAAEDAHDWCKANGKVKKDYQAFLRNWLRKNFTSKANQPTAGGTFARLLEGSRL